MAVEPAGRPLQTSHEKLHAFIDAQLQQAQAGVIGGVLQAWMPTLLAKLPEDPAILDQLIAEWAHALLGLRSDIAPYLEIVAGAPPTTSTATAEEIPTP